MTAPRPAEYAIVVVGKHAVTWSYWRDQSTGSTPFPVRVALQMYPNWGSLLRRRKPWEMDGPIFVQDDPIYEAAR